VLFAFNQGEVCTCPSRALIQESIYDRFIERAVARGRDQAGQPAGHRHDDGRAGLGDADGQDHVVPGGRQGRRARKVLIGGGIVPS
jgi:acyl-CoA reductase-like NAD-dependent aldehyde dehydrogenase